LPVLHTSRAGHVATIRLDHGRANALDTALCEALAATVRDLDADAEVHALVVTGSPTMFSAGVDLKAIVAADTAGIEAFLTALDAAFRALLLAQTPIVGAITGHAIAGGAIIAAACDHAIVTDDPRTQLGLSELQVGVPFPTSAIEIVRARCPEAVRTLVWLADTYGPEEAVRMGLVDAMAPAEEVLPRAQALAKRIASAPAGARHLSRAQLWADARAGLSARSDGWDPQVVDGWTSPEGRAAIAAFVAERLG
jgi:enoyl-CoA hydratase